jgi:AraC-like DNA-binding protein
MSLTARGLPSASVNRELHPSCATFAIQLTELVKQWRIPPADLLGPLGLDESQLEGPGSAISLETWLALFDRARRLTGDAAIGIHLGLQMRISAYGYPGVMAMSSPTIGDALALAIKYGPLVTSVFELRRRTAGSAVALVVEERKDVGVVRDAVLTSAMVGLAKVGASLAGRDLPVTIDLAIKEPPYYAKFAHVLPPTRFEQPLNQVVLDADVMDWKLVNEDRLMLRLARERCEHELGALCAEDLLVNRVRRLLPTDDGFRTVQEVASAIHMSTRTLKRRLAEQGVTYSSLVDRERRDKALLLLRQGDYSVNEVTQSLGYATLPAFLRAFRRWTNLTPKEYRRQHATTREPRSARYG